MKTNNHYVKLIALGCLSMMLQSCGIPTLISKKADTHLPEQFTSTAQQATSAQDTTNAADVNWKDFF